MAVPPTDVAFPARKGDLINVEVVEAIGDAVVIKFVGLDKVFHGVLLQDDSSYNQYGINLDRVRGAPFWPPPTTGVSLKTIPCSTERYSYKHDGQPSNLNVFQPEVIKRGNRHQPAPQLSRILRPRRFVCRKCKKAYHVEENGVEMSSDTLSLPTDPIAVDSSAFSCEVESVPINASAQSDSKCVRRNNTPPPSDGGTFSQSIRQVTPPIMPKLTEDYTLNGRDSEVDSNSDDNTVKRAKLIFKEKIDTSQMPLDKISISAKRKADPSSLCERQKKLKRSHRLSNKDKPGQPPLATSRSDPDSTSDVLTTSSSVTPEEKACSTSLDHSGSVNRSSLPSTVSNEAEVRKNRIKAQYVSVATPFRFPPSRSSKPNLLSIAQFTGSFSRENVSHKVNAHRTSKLSTDYSKVAGKGAFVASSAPATSAENSKSTHAGKLAPSGSQSSARYRSRARSVQRVMSNQKRLDPRERDLSSNANEVHDVVVPQPANPEPIGQNEGTQEVYCDTHPVSVACDPAATVTLGPSEPRSTHSSANSTVSQLTGTTDPTPIANRLKAVDYEKPKNRWIREARARRSYEERLPSISAPTNLNSTTSASVLTGNPPESFIEYPSSSLSRRSTRSSEGTPNINGTGTTSLKAAGSSKKRTTSHPEGSSISQEVPVSGESDQPIHTISSHLPPHSIQSSDSGGIGLPVLKIKINRHTQPSSGARSFAHYEVVELPVPNEPGVNSGQAALDVASAFSKSGSTSFSSIDEAGEVKGDINPNGLCSSPLSRKGPCSANSPGLGRPVKRCHLPDGVTFRVGDLVWSKLSGWPSWPAQITSIHQVPFDDAEPTALSTEYDFTDCLYTKTESSTSSKRFSYTACLHWFAWHQVSYMPCDKLFHFLQHYKRFDNRKKRGIFRHAVNEAKQKSEEQQLISSVSSDSDSADGALAEPPSQSVRIPSISHEVSERISPSSETLQAILPNESSVPELPTSVATTGLTQTSSENSLSHMKFCPRSNTTRTATRTRASNRGRLRSLRGRRGGSVSSGRTRSSPRNLPTFLPCDPRTAENTGNSDNLPVLRLTIPPNGRKFFRGRQRSLGRGRGSTSTRGLFGTNSSSSYLPFHNVPDVHSIASSGTLKMVLSAAKLKGPRRQNPNRKSLCRKQPKRDRNSTSVRRRSKLQMTQVTPLFSQHTNQCESSVDIPAYQPNDATSTSGQATALELSLHSAYDDPSAEILSQFPQVFPDLRASGILPNSVDIPTFSEDESEEEDSRRLIIDPDVMASVNASGSSSSLDRFRHIESIALQGAFHPSSVIMDPVRLGDQPRTDNYVSLDTSEFEHLSHISLSDPPFANTPVPVVSCTVHPHPILSTPCSAPSVLTAHTTTSLTHPCVRRTPHGGHPLSPMSTLNHSQPITEPYFRSNHANVPASVPSTMVPYVASDFTAL